MSDDESNEGYEADVESDDKSDVECDEEKILGVIDGIGKYIITSCIF